MIICWYVHAHVLMNIDEPVLVSALANNFLRIFSQLPHYTTI
uniref:Uncharacterized protein n=1 Tax=Rhizophora mucronata TaxID=61149 RepID=A0A2P2ND26_RHIMU